MAKQKISEVVSLKKEQELKRLRLRMKLLLWKKGGRSGSKPKLKPT